MNLYDYIEKYGYYTFDEIPLNEIDSAIFSYLSYIDLDQVVNNKITIKDAYKLYTSLNKRRVIKKKFYSTRIAIDILKNISKTKRYKDLLLYDYIYIKGNCQQFSAVTIELNKNLVFVSFEGTDEELAGWEEDMEMTYHFPVKAQKNAIRYLNRHFTFNRKRIIVGGHSKGGNLALVSSMYTNFLVRRKIINIYSNDGPGILAKQINSKRYDRIKDRYIHIVSQLSVVGLLLRHSDNYNVIKTKKGLFGAHTMTNWQVDDIKFKRTELSRMSKVLDLGLTVWLDKYDYDDRKLFCKSIFKIFKDNNINTLLDLKNNHKQIINLIKSSTTIDPKVKSMFKDGLKVIIDTRKEI